MVQSHSVHLGGRLHHCHHIHANLPICRATQATVTDPKMPSLRPPTSETLDMLRSWKLLIRQKLQRTGNTRRHIHQIPHLSRLARVMSTSIEWHPRIEA